MGISDSVQVSDQQKKDIESFAHLPSNVRSHLLSYGAGMMAMYAEGVADMAAKQSAETGENEKADDAQG